MGNANFTTIGGAQGDDWDVGNVYTYETGAFYRGYIDHVSLWNYPLSSEEIQTSYDFTDLSGLVSFEDHLQKAYSCDLDKELPMDILEKMYRRITKPFKKDDVPTIELKVPMIKQKVQSNIYDQSNNVVGVHSFARICQDYTLQARLEQEVVTADKVFSCAKEIAKSIASAAPLAVKETIKSAKIALEKGREAAVSEFDVVQEMLALSNDANEGVEAFKNKKTPNFKGN